MKFSDIEFDKICKVGNKSFKTNLFNVNWLLGRYCNYNCSYCWSDAHTKIKDHRSFEVIKNILQMIFNQAKSRGYDKFSFSFSGGEPTMHPQFIEILELINIENSKVNITTNLSRTLDWYKKLFETIDSSAISITCSFHPEFETKEKFLEKINFLKSKNVYHQINLVMITDRFNEMLEYSKYFYENNISVQIKPQVEYTNETTTMKKYTKEQLDIIQNSMPRLTKKYLFEMMDNEGEIYEVDNVERLIGLNFNRFKDWYCEAGYRSLIIAEPSGLIKRHYMCLDEPLGHIESGFKLYDKPIKCITDICGSCADCKIPKFKENIKK